MTPFWSITFWMLKATISRPISSRSSFAFSWTRSEKAARSVMMSVSFICPMMARRCPSKVSRTSSEISRVSLYRKLRVAARKSVGSSVAIRTLTAASTRTLM